MSIQSRIKRLETAAMNEFVVAIPRYFDSEGKEVFWSSLLQNHEAIERIDVDGVGTRREPGEEFRAFESRAFQLADEALNVTVWVHPAVLENAS